MRSAGAPLCEAALRQAHDVGRPAGHGAQQHGQRDLAGMDEPQPRRQHGLHADSPVRRFRKGLALRLHVLRIVVGDDDVDHALRQRLHHREPVLLVAQRRRELEEGAVVADVVLVQRQRVDRDAAVTPKPSSLARSRMATLSAQETSAAW